MSAKILRSLKGSDVSSFSLRRFSVVERGEHEYVMRSFADDEEFSVQDTVAAINIEEPETIQTKLDEITDADYLPPSKLAKAEDGIIGETVKLPKGRSVDDGFIESALFSDVEESPDDGTQKVVKTPTHDEQQEVLINTELSEKINTLEARIKELEEAKDSLEKSISEKDTEIENKNKDIETINAGIPEKLELAKAEGYNKGKEECEKAYEADKNDYIARIETFNKEASKKLEEVAVVIKSIDEQISDTVIGFVKSIVGVERKINDQFIVNLIKKNLERLNELKNVSFVVNPDDLEIVKSQLSDYVVSSDTAIEKGSVKVISKVGEISLDANIMIADLEKQINEELGATENLKA